MYILNIKCENCELINDVVIGSCYRIEKGGLVWDVNIKLVVGRVIIVKLYLCIFIGLWIFINKSINVWEEKDIYVIYICFDICLFIKKYVCFDKGFWYNLSN